MFLRIASYPSYEINEQGIIREIKTSKILTLSYTKRGFPKIRLKLDGVSQHAYLPKLVMHTFHPEIKGKGWIIRQKDGNPKNCSYSNLYFIKRSEMMKEFWEKGKYKNKINSPQSLLAIKKYRFQKGELNPSYRGCHENSNQMPSSHV